MSIKDWTVTLNVKQPSRAEQVMSALLPPVVSCGHCGRHYDLELRNNCATLRLCDCGASYHSVVVYSAPPVNLHQEDSLQITDYDHEVYLLKAA